MKEEIISYYDGYLDKLKTPNNRHQYVFNAIDRFIPENTKVLDIGCGAGLTSRHLAYGGRRVTGVDISPKLIQHAETYNSHFGTVTYYIADISEFEINEKFDAITMIDVLEHILPESLTALFNNIYRLSHDDTKVYLNIPSSDVLNFLHEFKPDSLQIVDNPIETGEIIRLFSNIGFVPIYYHLYWQHYVEFLFITRKKYNETFKGAFNG